MNAEIDWAADFGDLVPAEELARCVAAGTGPYGRALLVAHAAVRRLGGVAAPGTDTQTAYLGAVGAACDRAGWRGAARARLLTLLAGEERVYSGWEAVAPAEVWHHDVPGDGACALGSAMASSFVQRQGAWPGAAELAEASATLRRHLLTAARHHGDALWARVTRFGASLRSRVVAEYAEPGELGAAAELMERRPEPPTWAAVRARARALPPPRPPPDPDGDFLPAETVHSLLAHHVAAPGAWWSTVELDLVAHLSRLVPAWDPTEFRVYQLDAAAGALREAHWADGEDHAAGAAAPAPVCRVPLFSNGQNHVRYAGAGGASSHFSALVFVADLPAGATLPPSAPFRPVAHGRCPLLAPAGPPPGPAASLEELRAARRARECPHRAAPLLCAAHLGRYGSAAGVPPGRVGPDAPAGFRAAQRLPPAPAGSAASVEALQRVCDGLALGPGARLVLALPDGLTAARRFSARVLAALALRPDGPCELRVVDPRGSRSVRNACADLGRRRTGTRPAVAALDAWAPDPTGRFVLVSFGAPGEAAAPPWAGDSRWAARWTVEVGEDGAPALGREPGTPGWEAADAAAFE